MVCLSDTDDLVPVTTVGHLPALDVKVGSVLFTIFETREERRGKKNQMILEVGNEKNGEYFDINWLLTKCSSFPQCSNKIILGEWRIREIIIWTFLVCNRKLEKKKERKKPCLSVCGMSEIASNCPLNLPVGANFVLKKKKTF